MKLWQNVGPAIYDLCLSDLISILRQFFPFLLFFSSQNTGPFQFFKELLFCFEVTLAFQEGCQNVREPYSDIVFVL